MATKILMAKYVKCVKVKSCRPNVIERFDGASLEQRWDIPQVELTRSPRELHDFLGYHESVPIVSTRARSILGDLIDRFVEFLPFVMINGVQYFAINVVAHAYRCVDYEKSKVEYLQESKAFALNWEIRFAAKRTPRFPIFRIPEDESYFVYVNRDFVDLVRQSRLTGAIFLTPGKALSGWAAEENAQYPK